MCKYSNIPIVVLTVTLWRSSCYASVLKWKLLKGSCEIWPCDRWRCGRSSRWGRPTGGWCGQTSPWPHNLSWGGNECMWRRPGDRRISAAAGGDLSPTSYRGERRNKSLRLAANMWLSSVVRRVLKVDFSLASLTGQCGRVLLRQSSNRKGRTACPTRGNCDLCIQPDRWMWGGSTTWPYHPQSLTTGSFWKR